MRFGEIVKELSGRRRSWASGGRFRQYRGWAMFSEGDFLNKYGVLCNNSSVQGRGCKWCGALALHLWRGRKSMPFDRGMVENSSDGLFTSCGELCELGENYRDFDPFTSEEVPDWGRESFI